MSPTAWLGLFSALLVGLLLTARLSKKSRVARQILLVLCVISLILLATSPAEASTITEYRLLGTPTPWGIAVDSQGYPWFIEQGSNKIGRLVGGTLAEWQVPTVGSVPWGIILDPNGNPWFTESVGNKIGKLEFASNRFYEWPLPGADAEVIQPRGLVWNPSSTSADIWFTEYARDRIGHLRQTNGGSLLFSFYNISGPAVANPLSIAMSRIDHSVWWTEHGANRIGSIRLLDNGTALFRHYDITAGSKPWGIAVDPEGFVWVTENEGNNIGRLNPVSGEYVTFAIPTAGSEPRELVLELSTGTPPRLVNVWFTEFNKDRIGRYVPGTNVFFEYPIITGGGRPHGISLRTGVSKPDVWFSEPFGEKIGRLVQTVGPTVTTTVNTITSAATTSTTVFTARSLYVSNTTTISVPSTTVSSTASSVTSSATTLTDTSSVIRVTTTTIVTATVTSTSRSTTVTTSSTTSTATSVTVSTIMSTTSTTATTTSYIVDTTTASTSTTVTIVSVQTTQTTTSATATSTSLSPTVRMTVTNTSFLNTTTFSPTVTIQLTSTAISTTRTTTTTQLATTTTTTTTAAITRPCVIASAAFGSGLAPEVQCLREFRDSAVGLSLAGSRFLMAFNVFYYSFSPTVAEAVASQPVLASLARLVIYPLVGCLRVASAVSALLPAGAEASIVLAGLVASALIGLAYGLPVLLVLQFVRRSRR